MDRGILVAEHGGRVIARAHEVLDGSARIAERRREKQVMRDLGEVRIEVVAVRALEQATHRPVELEPPARREIAVQRLAHEVVGERVATWCRGDFGDQADGGRLREHGLHAGVAQPARALEQMQVELASDHGREPERRDRLAREGRHAATDQVSNLLGDAQERIPGPLVEARERVAGREEADDLTEEERIASRDLVQPRDGPATHGRFGHRRDVRLDVRRRQAPQRDPPSDPGELGEDVGQLAHALVGIPVGRHEQDPRLGQRVSQEAQQQQRGLVPRVQIVQDDDGSGARRRPRSGSALTASNRRSRPPSGITAVGARARRPGRAGAHDELLEITAQRADDLKPGPVRWRAALLPAATRDDPHPSLRANPGELAHQPRLADARLARDQHQRAAAGHSLLEREGQIRQLLDATDEQSHGGSPGDRGRSDLLPPSPLHHPSVEPTARVVQRTAPSHRAPPHGCCHAVGPRGAHAPDRVRDATHPAIRAEICREGFG